MNRASFPACGTVTAGTDSFADSGTTHAIVDPGERPQPNAAKAKAVAPHNATKPYRTRSRFACEVDRPVGITEICVRMRGIIEAIKKSVNTKS